MNIGLRKEAELIRCPQVDDEVFIVWVGRNAICWEAVAAFSQIMSHTSDDLGTDQKLVDCLCVSRIQGRLLESCIELLIVGGTRVIS